MIVAQIATRSSIKLSDDGGQFSDDLAAPESYDLTLIREAHEIVRIKSSGEVTFDWPGIERAAGDGYDNSTVRFICLALLAAKREG